MRGDKFRDPSQKVKKKKGEMTGLTSTAHLPSAFRIDSITNEEDQVVPHKKRKRKTMSACVIFLEEIALLILTDHQAAVNFASGPTRNCAEERCCCNLSGRLSSIIRSFFFLLFTPVAYILFSEKKILLFRWRNLVEEQ